MHPARVACAATALALSLTPTTGHAQGVGTGWFTPGLPSQGCTPQTWQFTTTGTVTSHFDGQSTVCESLSSGQGRGGFVGAFTCDVTYTRTYQVVLFSGFACAIRCVITPTSANPVTSFAIACTPHIEDARPTDGGTR